jgi:bifunctional non-homologous end joining protein LigD
MVQRVSLHPKLRPRFIEPMECRRVPTLPEGHDWLYGIKQDGYRAIGLVDGNSAMLYSISGQDYSSQFRHIAFSLQSLRRGDLILDGEIVALDEKDEPVSRNSRTAAPAGDQLFITSLTFSIEMDGTL